MQYRVPLALAALWTAASAAPAAAATYNVATNGSDSNNGITAPFRTLQKAASVIRDGDTILFSAGTYAAGAYITRRNITIRGVGSVILDGTNGTRDDGLSFTQTSGITLENLVVRNCRRMGIFVTLSQGLTIRNCEASGNAGSGILTGNTSDVLVALTVASHNGSHGIYFSQSGDRLRVSGCVLFNNQRAGLQINAVQSGASSTNPAADGISRDCVVENNTIYGNGAVGGSAINLMGVQNSLLVNNLIYNNLAGGIALWDDGGGSAFASKNNRLYHNTVVFQSGRGRYGVQCLRGSTGNVVMNNVLVTGSGPTLDMQERVQSNYNCLSGPSIANGGSLASWRSSTGNDLNSIQANPGLLSTYRLSSTSPARDAGYSVYGVDKDGRLRPQGPNPDIGCFEEPYGGTTPPPPVQPPPPAPTPSPAIYGDSLITGWTAKVYRAKSSLSATSPVAEGSRSIALTVTGTDGYLRISGQGLSLSGKRHVKFLVHGGSAGGQELRIRSYVNGVQQSNSLNLRNYGPLPKAGAWVEYTVPLADLKATAGSLTGLKIFAGGARKQVFIDHIRME